jgi:2-polyprenyl-3-methyl-5-hydroxy-6-metoxy-1,4-benzoquinol methylase
MGNSELDRKQHWECVYGGKPAQQTSWHQAVPRLSLSMIANTGFDHGVALIDVGGGASLLADFLLDLDYRDLTVLDISRAALDLARARLGDRALRVNWVEADVTRYAPDRQFEIWHDRAAFHFLTVPGDRQRYVRVLRKALAPGGQAVIATFAPSGPEKCSGLDIVRYDAAKLGNELGAEFVLQEQEEETHVTPANREQIFNFFRFRRRP